MPHLNNPAQPFGQVHRLVRGQPVLVEQGQYIVDDLVLSLGKELWLREGGLRDTCTGILLP